ncbi:MAG TPA: hypothetical protein VFW62_12795 [bacterium]|nr:hypothetical protein [bacterium]
MPTKKARGKSKASRATGKTKRSARKSTRKKSAKGAQRTQPTSLKKKVRRLSPGVVKSMKDMAGAVMAAAAAGALKGAVTAVLPPVRKAAGVTEEGRETKGPGEAPRSQDQREIRRNDTT